MAPAKTSAPKAVPTPTEMSVSFSFGTKINLGNYESADVHVSRSERWNVEGLSEEEICAHYDARYEVLQEAVMTQANKEYTNIKGSG